MRLARLMPGSHEPLEFIVEMQQVGNKVRPIAKPSPALKVLQYRFIDLLEHWVGKVQMSPVDNLLVHRNAQYVFQTDLQDAFPSVDSVRLGAILNNLVPGLGTPEQIEYFIRVYCMSPAGGLAQGAPASPLLFEIYCRFTVDYYLRQLFFDLNERGFPQVVWTRYVDDLTFSSQKPFPRYVKERIKEELRRAGFRIHQNKTTSLKRGVDLITITGGTLPPGRPSRLSSKFTAPFERKLDHLLAGKLADALVPSMQGSIAWFMSLESRVRGAKRDRETRRLLDKVERAQTLLRQVRLRKETEKKQKRLPFPRAWLRELRQKADLVQYVRECLPYEWAPKARGVKCPCPFCRSKRYTFTASSKLQTFHCFNAGCKEHGDIIQFAMLYLGVNFKLAVLQVATWAHVPLPEQYTKRHGVPQFVTPVQLELLPKTADAKE